EETEIRARITLGVLRGACGDVDGGLHELAAAREQAAASGRYAGLVVNADANLAAALEAVGRSEEAVATARRGVENALCHGLRDGAAFAAANEAESLLALGRWDEAAALAAHGRDTSEHALYLGWAATLLAHVAVLRGDHAAAEAEVAAAREHLGAEDRQ